MVDHRFRRGDRIKTQRDFDRVYSEQAYAADEVLVVRGCRNALPHSRLGLSVSRKVGNAVVRNCWKRLIREAFRLQRHAIPPGVDFVVRPRRGARLSFQAIARSLPRLSSRVARRLQGGPR